ncbi:MULTISPECIES: response regulator [unclassified Spirosoma]|uniref:response regulator n=1 Tax=unclassified Spirosoma TaxID=2621999 RepID=UPI00095BA3D7|nr:MULTISPECIES: response regulator [unclassified Spirosoma]MBN8823512.1 response regulator [Spirosoma sp.]OJW71880.1 MAG: response regulator [Spirosoma sp. 48-14]
MRQNFKRAKVLVIDDSSDHWLLIKKAMQHCLPEVTLVHVSSVQETLELLQEWNTQEWELPQLILQDLYLPTREAGWQLLNQIKAMSTTVSLIPLIMFSSSNDHLDVEEAYHAGVSSYLVKPIDYTDWVAYFNELRAYWWETVTLPPVQFSIY